MSTKEADPTNPTLTLLTKLEDYRAAINEHMLDAEVPFYDRIHLLFATQNGEARPTVERLQRAQSEIVRIGLMVGVLDTDEPYSVVTSGQSVESKRVPDIAVRANFAIARSISDNDRYWHESYGQGSYRTQSYAVVRTPTSSTATLAETYASAGSAHENLAAQIASGADAMTVGDQAILQSFEGNSVLQTAFLRAGSSMVIELTLASEALKATQT